MRCPLYDIKMNYRMNYCIPITTKYHRELELDKFHESPNYGSLIREVCNKKLFDMTNRIVEGVRRANTPHDEQNLFLKPCQYEIVVHL